MTEFLTGLGLGYLCGTVAGAVAAAVLFQWVKSGTVIINLPLLMEEDIESPTLSPSSENTTKPRLH